MAATGPSLTLDVSAQCRSAHAALTHRIVAVNDAYRLLPFADVLYACDATWWDVHKGCPDFAGEKWTSHQGDERDQPRNDKTAWLARSGSSYGLHLIRGRRVSGFSTDPSIIHYGDNSGFQAINLTALRMGFCGRILLVGFDMHENKGRHFFGNHPRPLGNSVDFASFVPAFRTAAAALPASLRIVNCTPGSALNCFPFGILEAELGVNVDHPVAAATS